MIKPIFLLLMCAAFSCQEGSTNKKPRLEDNAEEITIKVDPSIAYQTMEHFGASDAWSTQFVGTWPEEKRSAIADLLFSKEMDEDGNPRGIGLSLWRFNLGAGSTEQGEQSGIGDEWRRAPSLLDENGDFVPNGQPGQMWFAQAAKERGVENLLVFLNSPHVSLTRNSKAFTDEGSTSNLAPENYEAFAEYLSTAIEGMAAEGLKVDYISPVNEPQWDWEDGGQEGTPFWNHEIAGIVSALDGKLQENGLDTKIDIAEAGQIEYLYEVHNRPGRSDQVSDFFSSESDNFIGDLPSLSNGISGHSYFTTAPFEMAVEKRRMLHDQLQEFPSLKYWMSEYCILGDNNGEINGNGRDLGIDAALYMARIIHMDLVISQATAWHWWLGVSPYDYKDGLVYIDRQKEDGSYYESKMLWALGNYSRFVRPGFERIAVEGPDRGADFLFSGYKDPKSDDVVLVFVNSSIGPVKIDLDMNQVEGETMAAYLTTAEKSLHFTEVEADAIAVPARSVMTLTTKKKP